MDAVMHSAGPLPRSDDKLQRATVAVRARWSLVVKPPLAILREDVVGLRKRP
jgi:hypothetical protein